MEKEKINNISLELNEEDLSFSPSIPLPLSSLPRMIDFNSKQLSNALGAQTGC